MAIERRQRRTKGRRKEYSYRVKWRFQGTGPQQSCTVDTEPEAKQLDAALAKAKWDHLSSDLEIRTLSIIGASREPRVKHEAERHDLTVAEAVHRWATRPGLSTGSRRVYAQCHDRLGKLGEQRVSLVSAEDVDDWFNRQGEELSSNTLHIMRIAIRGAFKTYHRQDATANLAKVNPRRNVVPIYLTLRQLDALVAKAQERSNYNFAVLVRLVGTMGLRWGEAMALQVGSLYLEDPDRPSLWVRRAVKNNARLQDGFVTEPVKSSKAERLITLTPALGRELRLTTAGCGVDDVVFKPPNSAFWNHRTFIYQWNRLCEATPEVPDNLRFHDLRHTAAKNMLEVDQVPIAYVSQILGHSKVDITVKEYGMFDQHSHDLVRRLMSARGRES